MCEIDARVGIGTAHIICNECKLVQVEPVRFGQHRCMEQEFDG